jgi:hypothetical protein
MGNFSMCFAFYGHVYTLQPLKVKISREYTQRRFCQFPLNISTGQKGH